MRTRFRKPLVTQQPLLISPASSLFFAGALSACPCSALVAEPLGTGCSARGESEAKSGGHYSLERRSQATVAINSSSAPSAKNSQAPSGLSVNTYSATTTSTAAKAAARRSSLTLAVLARAIARRAEAVGVEVVDQCCRSVCTHLGSSLSHHLRPGRWQRSGRERIHAFPSRGR